MLLMFALVEYDMLSGGALGSLALGATAAACWRNGRPRVDALTLGPAPGFADELDAAVAVLWDWCARRFYVCLRGAWGSGLRARVASKQNIDITTPRTHEPTPLPTQTIYMTIPLKQTKQKKARRAHDLRHYWGVDRLCHAARQRCRARARHRLHRCVFFGLLFLLLWLVYARPSTRDENQTKTQNTKTGLLVRALSTFATMWGRIGGCACVVGGGAVASKACARCCAGGCAGGGAGAGCGPSYTWREALFFAVAWTPKATVQAALSGAPLHVVRFLRGVALLEGEGDF